MSDIQSITVIGATGMLGAPVTRELLKAGYRIRALVRDSNKAREKLPDEVELIVGDLKNNEDVEKAFQDAHGVYVSLSTGPFEQDASFRTEIDGLKNILDAAIKQGVKRVGYLSSLVKDYTGIDWWVFDIKREACRLLKAAEIPVTIFYPSNFMENFPGQQLMGKHILLMGRQETKSWYIAGSDYGRQVAHSFRLKGGQDREFPIQGPDAYSFQEAARVFADNYTHADLKILQFPMWIPKLAAKFSRQADFGVRIVEAINHYDEQFQSRRTWEELGYPKISLAEFARSL